ncbi:MAG: M20/M25/M40 family metallo-hydrolase [Gemmatimonadetes bacterium]|nr:MAG: M20/M25/M40 family metallo-hydrolase [Gemmatimonadota bacterium]
MSAAHTPPWRQTVPRPQSPFHRVLPALVALTVVPLARATPAAAQTIEAEVRALLEDPRVEAAFRHIVEHDAETMRDLVTLTEIPAPPFKEAERGQAFLARLRQIGVDSAWVDEEGNVLGLRRGTGGSGRTVVVSGHLDTVFPEGTDVTVKMRGDTLFAPGVGDDTRGLATVLAVLRAMNAVDLSTEADILFVGTVGEEGLGDLRGVKHLFREGGPRIDAFISVDGISDRRVTHEGLGSHRYRVTVKGPGGHSWGAFGLANPAHALGRAITYFDVAADAFTRSGPRTSYNVGVLEGGTSVNSIPFEVSMLVDMRSESQEALVRLDSIFQRVMRRAVEEANEARRHGDPLTLEVEMIGNRPSGEVAADHPFVQRAVAATRLLGLEPQLGRSSTDSNIPISKGIPAVTLGGGGVGGGAHSPDEWFLNENGPRGIQRVLLVLVAEAGLAPVG